MTSLTRYKEGYQWIDKPQNAQVYKEAYDTSLACPLDCGIRLSRLDYETHVRYACPRRSIACEFCGKEFSSDAIEAHQGNCPLETVWCENKCGARLQRRHLPNHSQNECHKRTVTCSYCHKQFVYETLQDHHYQCSRFMLSCPNRCDAGKVAREEMTAHLSQLCRAAVIPCQFREIGCKALHGECWLSNAVQCRRCAMESHQASAARSHLSLVCSLAVDQQRQIDELSSRLAAVSSAHAAPDGSFLWRITGFKSKAGLEVKSAPFYTSPYGYRLRASLFPSGTGSGEGTHLSIYIRVIAGDYDALLDWPFRFPISVILYAQDAQKRQHVVESFVPSTSCKQFQRPTRDMSGADAVSGVGFGYPRFLSLEQLHSGLYVRDDTIFVKFKVEQTLPVIEHC